MAPEVRYDGVHCAIAIERPAPEVLVLRISGTDVGEFGDAPMQGLDERLAGGPPVRLFIDARDTRGASIEVSADWARWLGTHRQQLRAIDMLTGSRYIEVTAGFVRRFADLHGVMRIYTDPKAFDAALADAI
jgi:hypothetical protein